MRYETQPRPIPLGTLNEESRGRLASKRDEILSWALIVDETMSQDECDTPTRLATLASLTRTKNKSLYDPWLAYITKHDGFMCPTHWDCTLVTPFFCTMDKVATFANLARPDPGLMIPRLGDDVCDKYDSYFVLTSCNVNDQGSALHLASLDVYIRRQIGDWNSILQAAADKLHSRDPLNVWFEWLALGASDELSDRLLSQVPAYNVKTSERKQWSFVREDTEMAYKNSMGWEFVFLIDHLLSTPRGDPHSPNRTRA
eukprot:g148.t1